MHPNDARRSGGAARRRLVTGTAAFAFACLSLVACGGGSGGSEGTATGRFGGLHTEVCRAAAEAEAGDLAAARRTFDDVHVGLHDLAAAAEQEDRAVAARLLEAKQRVEADATAPTLQGLVAPVVAAVEITGGTAPDRCT